MRNGGQVYGLFSKSGLVKKFFTPSKEKVGATHKEQTVYVCTRLTLRGCPPLTWSAHHTYRPWSGDTLRPTWSGHTPHRLSEDGRTCWKGQTSSSSSSSWEKLRFSGGQKTPKKQKRIRWAGFCVPAILPYRYDRQKTPQIIIVVRTRRTKH